MTRRGKVKRAQEAPHNRAKAAFDAAEATRPIVGSHFTELRHPLIHEWLREAYERHAAGRISWATALVVIRGLCEEHGLPALKSSVQVISHYARRHFGRG